MARVYDVELDIRYISIRMLLWIAAALAQWVWIGLRSSVTSHTAPLSKVIAAATSAFALRDVFITIFLVTPTLPLLYWTTLLRSVADGVFVVCLQPCASDMSVPEVGRGDLPASPRCARRSPCAAAKYKTPHACSLPCF